jgi:hypothetical protein
MFKAYVGHSNDPDSQFAVAEVLQQCIDALAGEQPRAGVLFAAFDFDHALILAEINKIFPDIELIGSTTNGEMSSVMGFQEDSLVLLLFCADECIEISTGIGRNTSQNLTVAVEEAIATATAKLSAPPQLCLTFPDGLTVSGVAMLAALKQGLGDRVPIIGGLAADNYSFERTYQFFQNEVISDAIPILLFSGELLYSYGVASGWQPIGKQSQITKAEGNVVYEIDGQKALDFYEYYLGIDWFTNGYAIHALAIFEADLEHFYLRAPVTYDRDAGSITFFSDIPVGAIVQNTTAVRPDIIKATDTSFQTAVANYPGTSPALALFISCAARRRILGTQAKAEFEIVKAQLPSNLPCCGLYSYGEISPLVDASVSKIARDKETQFHNQTFVTLLVGDT